MNDWTTLPVGPGDTPNGEPHETLAGFFEYRERKGAPLQALRIVIEDRRWTVLVNGILQPGSGSLDWRDLPIILNRWPFHRVTRERYDLLLAAHRDAPPGSPLKSPGQAVDLRQAPAGYRREE